MDAYLVLGHADQYGVIDHDCQLRIQKTNAIGNKQAYLFLSGGCKADYQVTEAFQMQELIIAWPKELIFREEYSTNTAENAWFLVSLLPEDVTEITIICSRAHSIRARIFFFFALRFFHKKIAVRFLYSRTPGFKAWWYEMRYLHHIVKNIRNAKKRYKTLFP